MSKNYYEILEINKNASQEIVEKAYKTLAKKYHPDLQQGEKKAEYEEKLKLINEAYETLSDPEKREKYNQTLPSDISAEEYENLYRQKEYMKQRITRMEQEQNSHNYSGPNQNTTSQTHQPPKQARQPQNRTNAAQQAQWQQRQAQAAQAQAYQDAINKAYHDAYINELRNRGVRIKYKKTWKDYLTGLITIIVIILFFIILWHIPPFHNLVVQFYNENFAFRFIADIFIGILNTIKQIFTSQPPTI